MKGGYGDGVVENGAGKGDGERETAKGDERETAKGERETARRAEGWRGLLEEGVEVAELARDDALDDAVLRGDLRDETVRAQVPPAAP